MAKHYDKYEKQGDIHWQWLVNNSNYQQLLTDSVDPLEPHHTNTQSVYRDTGQRKVVLDVGAGDGVASGIFLDKGYRVVAVEPSDAGNKWAIHHLGEDAKNLGYDAYHVVNATAEEFAWYLDDHKGLGKFGFDGDGTVDYLYCLNTIEHLNRPEVLVRMMRHASFGVIVTDDRDSTVTHSEYHEREFNIKELKTMFDYPEFLVREININVPTYIGVTIQRVV